MLYTSVTQWVLFLASVIKMRHITPKKNICDVQFGSIIKIAFYLKSVIQSKQHHSHSTLNRFIKRRLKLAFLCSCHVLVLIGYNNAQRKEIENEIKVHLIRLIES